MLTDTRSRFAHASLLVAAIVATILALGCGLLAASAHGDGDPASDVLVAQPLFLAQDAGSPPRQQAQLTSLLAAGRRNGYPLRVALIASAADLGSVTALWRQPQNYARFLGQELSLVYRGPLLVVMPSGFGQYHLPAAGVPMLRQLAPPGRQLGTAALTAIQRLAAASGHALPIPTAAAPGHPSASGPIPWIVFAVGTVLIAAAWIASLRARPLQLGRRATSS